MKQLISAIALLIILGIFICCDKSKEKITSEAPNISTFYFIRHAEKDRSDPENRDPHLTQAGQLRAAKWSEVLNNVTFDAIYSTDYNRTKETAQPTADKNILEITFYNPQNIDGRLFSEANKGKTVLVVGHSDTTPAFVNSVINKKKYNDIDDSNNGNLYIVTITNSIAKSTVLYIE